MYVDPKFLTQPHPTQLLGPNNQQTTPNPTEEYLGKTRTNPT